MSGDHVVVLVHQREHTDGAIAVPDWHDTSARLVARYAGCAVIASLEAERARAMRIVGSFFGMGEAQFASHPRKNLPPNLPAADRADPRVIFAI